MTADTRLLARRMTYDEVVLALRQQGVPLQVAEMTARREFGISDIKNSAPDTRREKEIEHEGDRLMLAHGFEVVRLSQARRSKVHPGLPDRRYYRRPRAPSLGGPWTNSNQRTEAMTAWWEAKSATGHQRPEQRVFQEMVEACGETYILGGITELTAWLKQRGIL